MWTAIGTHYDVSGRCFVCCFKYYVIFLSQHVCASIYCWLHTNNKSSSFDYRCATVHTQFDVVHKNLLSKSLKISGMELFCQLNTNPQHQNVVFY